MSQEATRKSLLMLVYFPFMDRWSGILKVPLHSSSSSLCRVAASLCLSPTSRTLTVPSVNAIFFNGDQVEGTGNPVIERLSDLQRIAEILVLKFGGSTNAWVIEASTFNGPFAVYKDFIPSVNQWGEPQSYDPTGFPASESTVLLLSNCLEEARKIISERIAEPKQIGHSTPPFVQPRTKLLGFSKGGVVLNQLVAELGFSGVDSIGNPMQAIEQPINGGPAYIQEETQTVPTSRESFLNSITEIHYVDVGLNSAGAYLTDQNVIERISKRLAQGPFRIRFILHGTPRQWCDNRRVLIRKEKETLVRLLISEDQRSGGKLLVYERLYFAGRPPTMQMHFEVIENLDVS
ncbi:hypothetical protein RJ640_002027 [Escallonia rubra]|uniref:Uncharacterized protein n=1 Tax=Escallonia rubra TaxID=112253 RepID=A0AA88QQ71_9ASTE|nr:hypothetical protein RJ640_002027 [Escallonia rubra]